MKRTSIKRVGRYGLATLIVVGLVLWLLGVSLLPGLVKTEIENYGQRIGYKIDVAEVHVSPLLLKAEANDLKISSDADGDLLSLKHVSLSIRFWPLVAGELHFGSIALDSPHVSLQQGTSKDAPWNWVTFINALSGPEDAVAATTKVAIDALLINSARLSIRQGQSNYSVGPFSIELQHYRNVGEDGQVGGLASDYVLNLGKLSIPVSSSDGLPTRQLVFDRVSLKGSAHQRVNQDYQVRLDVQADSGKLSTRWDIDAKTNEVTGHLVIESLPVVPLVALAPTYQPLQTLSGTLDAAFDLAVTAKLISLSGNGAINHLDVRIEGSNDILLACQQAQVDQLKLNLPVDGQAGSLSIKALTFVQPVSRFEIDAQQGSNFRQLFSKPGAEAVVAAASASGPGFRYDVKSIRVHNALLHFADRSIRPEFEVDIHALNGNLLGLSNQPNQYASLALDGRVGKSGSLRGRGQVAFAQPRLNNDVSLLFKNIPLKSTNPYSMTFAGYQIDDGRIDADLRYVTKDGQLEGKNRFVIKKIKLGEEVPDYQGTRLPLGLAVALLEDADGMIDVNIPVKGNVNDPEFSVGHLVWQAVTTVLNNLVTAPFRAMGALLGIENMDQISFVEGESALLPADQESLEKVAGVLVKRPGSQVVIQGGYDPVVDAPALARAMADRAVLAAAGVRVDRVQIDETQLRQLANERAQQAQRVLLSAAPGLAERVSLGEPVQVSADGNAVGLIVQLQRY